MISRKDLLHENKVRPGKFNSAFMRDEESENRSGRIDLGFHPGESIDSFENKLYPHSGFEMHSINPLLMPKNMNQAQPSLAGCGALEGSSQYGQFSFAQTSQPDIEHTRYQPQVIPSTPVSDKNYSDKVSTPLSHDVANSSRFQPEVPWEYPREKLYIRQKIGEGSFGEVWQAKAEGILGRAGKIIVAVKMLKGQSDNVDVHRYI